MLVTQRKKTFKRQLDGLKSLRRVLWSPFAVVRHGAQVTKREDVRHLTCRVRKGSANKAHRSSKTMFPQWGCSSVWKVRWLVQEWPLVLIAWGTSIKRWMIKILIFPWIFITNESNFTVSFLVLYLSGELVGSWSKSEFSIKKYVPLSSYGEKKGGSCLWAYLLLCSPSMLWHL